MLTLEDQHNELDNTSNTGHPKKRKILKTVVIGIVLCFILVIIAAFGAALYVAKALQPAAPSEQEVQVVIPAGTDSGQIALLLEKHGLIRNGLIFKYYLKYKKQGAKFQAGVYKFTPGMTHDQFIERLNKGETVKEEVIRFTIPEGYNVEQIADRLSEQNFVDRQVFMKLVQGHRDFAAETVTSIPNNALLKQRLEGYLFPDTYELKKGSSEQEIIDKMLLELDRKLSELPGGWQEKLKEYELDIHQMLTLASLIEREVVIDGERALVAGVILNRIKRNMPLQIDATVQYSLEQPKERLFHADLKVESPYNTYLHAGLPPGPIASPSLNSIKAVLYPQETKFLFYVTKKDGSHTHLFAETFEQHQRNIAESNKIAKER